MRFNNRDKRRIMRKDNGDLFFKYWEDKKLNQEFSVHFSHGGRMAITPDNNEEILEAAKKLYGKR